MALLVGAAGALPSVQEAAASVPDAPLPLQLVALFVAGADLAVDTPTGSALQQNNVFCAERKKISPLTMKGDPLELLLAWEPLCCPGGSTRSLLTCSTATCISSAAILSAGISLKEDVKIGRFRAADLFDGIQFASHQPTQEPPSLR